MATAQDFLAAIKAGKAAEVTRLLDVQPALVNARDEHGLSAALTAAYYQEPGIAGLLVERGARVNPRLSSSGKTPLALAIEHQHAAVAELLKQHSAVE